jgi:uncharacterized protein involved in exopolysaccharide biosynthesis
MAKIKVNTLADIARALNTTPQAVSNWKSRDQVPYHIESKLKYAEGQNILQNDSKSFSSPNLFPDENILSISDIFVTLAEQLKIIILIPIITVFLSFTYFNFIQKPLYQSSATILLPEKNNKMGGFAGLASQFGVNVPTEASVDLSSPKVLPELINSRTFGEKILYKEFFTKEYNKKLPLIDILNGSNSKAGGRGEKEITKALSKLATIINFKESLSGVFRVINVKTFDPVFAKELAEVVIEELVKLNSFFQNKTANEKINFIDRRIYSVKVDLEKSEEGLKNFNQRNRQISSPALQLQLDRLTREVEVQTGIYLVLKQQHELAKIEEVQGASILQVLDEPQIEFVPINKNLKLIIFVAAFFGLVVGIILALVRGAINSLDIDKRKKVKKGKKFLKNKVKDFMIDSRISMVISSLLLLSLPFYLSFRSEEPLYFGLYSNRALLVAIIYVLLLAYSLFYSFKRKKL